MAKRVKPTAATVTILPTSDLRFGGHLDYEMSVPITEELQAYFAVTQNGEVVGEGYSTGGDWRTSFPLGPTPKWTAGGGHGSICVKKYNNGDWDIVRGSAVPFEVAA